MLSCFNGDSGGHRAKFAGDEGWIKTWKMILSRKGPQDQLHPTLAPALPGGLLQRVYFPRPPPPPKKEWKHLWEKDPEEEEVEEGEGEGEGEEEEGGGGEEEEEEEEEEKKETTETVDWGIKPPQPSEDPWPAEAYSTWGYLTGGPSIWAPTREERIARLKRKMEAEIGSEGWYVH